jgi:hypothetical protein
MLFSVVWCISRCLCCGLSCCCECCYCLKCCGNCCGCCDPPRGKKHKYLDEPFVPPHHAAYKAHEPMVAGPPHPAPSHFATPPFPPARSAGPGVAGPPQYAEFDVSKKGGAAVGGGHEDALPVMPTWESAGSKKVLVEEEEVEMDQLKKPEAGNAAGQNVPLMTGASAVSGPVSPIPSPDHRSPYSPPGGPGGNGGYIGASATDPYAAGGRGYANYSGPGTYGLSQSTLGTDQGYAMTGGAAMAGPGRRSPRDYMNNNNGYGQVAHDQDGYQDSYGTGQAYPPARPAVGGYDDYSSSRQDSYSDYNSQPQPSNQGYGRGQGMRTPAAGAYPQERMGRALPPHAAEYGGARTYPPAPIPQPQRQPTYEMPAEPVAANDSGAFDFSGGYSRPQQTPAGRHEMPDPGYGGSRPVRVQQGSDYQGYRGYGAGQQQRGGQQGWNGM